MKDIDDILNFRPDISPFLVHLTRTSPRAFPVCPASDVLQTILQEGRLICSDSAVSDARFGMNTLDLSAETRQRLFSAICFTETPLGDVHNLLEIAYRGVNLEPYGIVFLKQRLETKGVSPVLYFNNTNGDQDHVFTSLCSLPPPAAEQVLPLVSVFGQKIWPLGAVQRPGGLVDFRWEREWRRPFVRGPMLFISDDVFMGLCPHGEIRRFEALLPGVGFIDPTRNMKWYATKLIEARQRLNLKVSVV